MVKSKKNRDIAITKSDGDSSFFMKPAAEQAVNDLFAGEGQLICDVYQDQDNIIVKSTVSGVEPEDLDISVANDLITIRGSRKNEDVISDEDYFCRECYWGTFSRSIVLPQEVDQNKVSATIKNGILTVVLPKKYKTTSIKVKRIEE